MKRITINVTAEDIAKGCTGEATSCPIALAARRAGLVKAAVDANLEYDLDGIGKLIGQSKLPEPAEIFVSEFDAGKQVKPFTFEIDVEDIEDASKRYAERYESWD